VDIHSRTAALLFDRPQEAVAPEQRRQAKTINFGLLYGMGPQKMAQDLGITVKAAKDFIAKYFSRLTRLKEFYEGIVEEAKKVGYVTTVAGRRRLLPDLNSRNDNLAETARRQAINTRIQGSAADIIKLAMLAVEHDKELQRLDARLILQVHDELLLEAPEANAREAGERLAELMRTVYKLTVPVDVDWGVGKNWGEAH
jgi:DNA polymerase-1